MATSSDQSEKSQPVMVVAIDESDHSAYALKWTLDHFFNAGNDSVFKLVLVHARPSATSSVGLAGPGMIIFNFNFIILLLLILFS
jgi:hypothetical protein